MSHLSKTDLPQAASLQGFRDGKQDVLEESSAHRNSKVNRLEVGVQILETEARISTTKMQPLAFSLQCHICGWEYVANGRCERCGN